MLKSANGRRYGSAVRLLSLVALLTAAAVGVFVTLYRQHGPHQKPAPAVTGVQETQTAGEDDSQAALGRQLYANYCAACHGDKGDGKGLAARFLYPKPRNFGELKFRIVSAENRLPTDADLLRVLEHGMPGSAMFSFGHLPESDRSALVAHVRGLMTAAVETNIRRLAKERGEEVDADEMRQSITDATRPGKTVEVPDRLPDGPDSIARGKALYGKTCASCHGTTGRGDGAQAQQNDDGTPTRPRDFTRGIFKSGRDYRQVYARILLGMPGSPMPASAQSSPQEVSDLAHFILSLSDPGADARVTQTRQRLSVRRAPATLPADLPDSAWEGVPATSIVVSPLWWRDYADPDLRVQGLHDGQTLALRLSWADTSRNDQAVRTEDFEDMAAVQFFRGAREPFLGMGSADNPVDVWQWRAARRGPATPDVDTAHPHMAVDLYPFEKPGSGSHTITRQAPEFLTAQAAGNLRADPTALVSSLIAKGFGTLTLRPRISQVVTTKGSWKDGRWTVLLRRPLSVDREAGLPLAVGEKVSAGFALWDGAARDRNGQKLVSIWHDLELEP